MRAAYHTVLFLLSFASIHTFVHAEETPITIMIGIDGLRTDAIDRVPAPTLRALAKRGVRSKGMIPAMPSKTFVNFYSLATGLHPKHHGFTSNYPYDRKLGRAFDRKRDSQNPDWWGGEPIWITAEKQGVKTATYFWVGSEVPVDGIRPSYWKPFQQDKDYGERVEELLGWLSLPEAERPRLATLYFSAVDTAAHSYGVGSTEEQEAILKVDRHIGDLIAGLQQRGLFEQTNIIAVSDHGMTNLSDERVINLDKLTDLSDFIIPDWNKKYGPSYAPFLNLYGPTSSTEETYKKLKDAHPNMRVFKRGNFPSNYHFDHPDREPDLMILADTGWTLYASEDGSEPTPVAGIPWSTATHGYDNQHKDMHATFIAAGPAFKSELTADHFDNIEVYGILACALGISPSKTDGNIKNIANIMLKNCK